MGQAAFNCELHRDRLLFALIVYSFTQDFCLVPKNENVLQSSLDDGRGINSNSELLIVVSVLFMH